MITSLSTSLGLPTSLVPSGSAATIDIGTISGQVSDHVGDIGTASTNCIRYAPTGGATSSAFVTSPAEARTAHGYPSLGFCPGTLNTSQQSAVGIAPSSITSVTDGAPFLLGRATHYNNPISAGVATNYTGNLALRMSGFDAGANRVDLGWTMWETPNSGTCAFPSGPNQNGCADQITFSSQISDGVLTKGGVQYKVVVDGFTPVAGGTACPATPAGAATSEFLTAESATTASCLYASLVQVRSLKIVKQVVANGATPPGFGFNSTSDLAGSPWAASSFTLTPPSTSTNQVTRQLLQSETVSVTEAAPSGDQWALTDLRCVDGTGAAVPEAGYDLAARRLTLTNIGAPTTAAAGPITCTFTNTYTPKATLSLVKQVNGGTATANQWTLSAAGPTPVSGLHGSPAVTTQRVGAGSYTLSETGPAGYLQQGNWSCTAGTLAGNRLTLADGQNAVCTVTNRFATGGFAVTKTIVDPDNGFTGTASTPFSGSYRCGTAAPVAFSVSTGTPFNSPQLPAGTQCTITETAPSGNLANGSYTWGVPAYSPSPTVTVTDGERPTVAVTNTISQRRGTLRLAKLVQPAPGTPAAGYTGGNARPFPVDYTCRIAGTVVAQGSTEVTPGSTTTVPNLPATAVCEFSETLTARSGDFANDSYSWTSHSFAPQSVTIVADQAVSSTVTNVFTRNFADLTITKAVVGGGYTGTGPDFEVTVDCGDAPTVITLPRNGSRTVQVPANTLCSVQETTPDDDLLQPAYDWGTPAYAGLTDGRVSVPNGGTRTVAISNPTIPVFGTLSVTKAIAPNALAGAVVAGTTFPIRVSCNAPAQGEQSDYAATFRVGPDGSQTTPNLPAGTRCAVDETAPTGSDGLVDASYVWGAAPAQQDVTVPEDDNRNVTVTNTLRRAYGSLALTKVVEPLDGVDGAATTFSGEWTCTYGADPAVSGTWSRTGAGPATLSGMPADGVLIGSVCSVTEGAPQPGRPSADDSSYAWGAPTITGPVTVTAADPSQRLTVTNPVRRIRGDLALGKVVDGAGAGVGFVDQPFSFTWSCRPEGGGTPLSGTLAVRDGQTLSLPAGTTIPAGSTCTVTEGANPDPIDPYRWEPEVSFRVSGATGTPDGRSVTFTTPSSGAPVIVIAHNANSPRTGSVTVTKRVIDPDGGLVGDPEFAMTVTCDGVAYGPQQVRADGTATFDSIPLGARCDASEGAIADGAGLADDSFDWVAPPQIAPAQIRIAEGGQAGFTVTNTIERSYGAIALTKLLDEGTHPGVVSADRTYSGTWTCSYGDTTVSGTWSVQGPGAATLTGPAERVLLTSTCTATEDDLGAVSDDPSFVWDAPEISPTGVSASGPNRIEVANSHHRTTGSLRVAKTVTGETAGYRGDGKQFAVGYHCYASSPDDGPFFDGSTTVAAGASPELLAAEIPTGWTCAVSEAAPGNDLLRDSSYAWGDPVLTIDGEQTTTLTVDADGTLIEVTNPITRVLGTVTVSKALAGDVPDGVVADDAVYTGAYRCVYREGTDAEEVIAGTWRVTGIGAATLTPDVEVPLGTVCSATEDDPTTADLVDTSWRWQAPALPEAVTVTSPEAPADLQVTNAVSRVHSALRLTKANLGLPDAFAAGTEVTGSWNCRYDGLEVGNGRWRLDADGESTLLFGRDRDIPAESECTVTEDTLDDADLTDASWTWRTPIYEPAGGLITLPAQGEAAVRISNDTERVYGDFEIRKVVEGPADDGITFSGSWSCQYGALAPQTGTWSITGSGTQRVPGILATSTCSVTEDPAVGPVAADDSYVWLPPTITPGTVTVPATGEGPTTTVTNTAQRVTGAFAITKDVTGATDGVAAEATFGFDYRCVARNGDVFAGESTQVADGGMWNSPTDIPRGSTCTVSEQDLPALLEPWFSWGEPSYQVSGLGAATPAEEGVTFVLRGSDAPIVVTVENPVQIARGSYTIAKGADPASGSTVKPGDLVTYQVTVTPDGPPIEQVVVSDDLADVLDDATLVDGTINAGQGTASVTGQTLTWNLGTIRGTTPITLSYQVRVDADAIGAVLRNVVTGTGAEPPSSCEPCTTEHPTPGSWRMEKSADPRSGATVRPGDTITYTVRAQSLSQATAINGVEVRDTLSQVLAHARFDGFEEPEVGTAELTGTQLVWSIPELAAGSTAELRYRVVVDDDAWNVRLHNLITATATDEPPAPCRPADGADRTAVADDTASVCGTEHPTPPESGVLPEAESRDGDDDGVSGLLPDTGAPAGLAGTAVVGAALIGAGLWLLRRRRRSSGTGKHRGTAVADG